MRTNYKFKKKEAKDLGVAFEEIGREEIGEIKSEICYVQVFFQHLPGEEATEAGERMKK